MSVELEPRFGLLKPTQLERARHIDRVRDFMESRRLSLADLTEVGGEDLRLAKTRKKALLVERCWALMARLGVTHADLE
jgi:hypothetical protein